MTISNWLRGLRPRTIKDPRLDGKTFIMGLGATKAGSSWIFQYLNKHSQIICSPLKEVHFFDAKFGIQTEFHEARVINRVLDHINRDDQIIHRMRTRPHFQASVDRMRMVYSEDAYFEHFARIADPAIDTLCEFTPTYQVLPVAGFRFMKEFFSAQGIKLKFVFIIRDPIERFWSHCLFLQGRDPDFAPIDKFAQHLEGPIITNRSDYEMTIRNFLEVFSRDQIYIEYYENFFTSDSVSKLCEFIGIDFADAEFSDRWNETSVQGVLPEENRKILFDRFRHVYTFCDAFLDEDLPQTWQDAIAKYGS